MYPDISARQSRSMPEEIDGDTGSSMGISTAPFTAFPYVCHCCLYLPIKRMADSRLANHKVKTKVSFVVSAIRSVECAASAGSYDLLMIIAENFLLHTA